MTEALYIIRDNIYFTWFALLIFFTGFCVSYIVNYFNIELLTWFPRTFISFMSRFINPRAGFFRIFLIIFLFNSISIAVYMATGLFMIFPFIIAFLTGMNIGLTVFVPPSLTVEGYDINTPRSPGQIFRMIFFSTMVMILEVMVFSLALGMGMSLGAGIWSANAGDIYSVLFVYELLALRLKAYFMVCVPVLAVSAYLEASVIKGA